MENSVGHHAIGHRFGFTTAQWDAHEPKSPDVCEINPFRVRRANWAYIVFTVSDLLEVRTVGADTPYVSATSPARDIPGKNQEWAVVTNRNRTILRRGLVQERNLSAPSVASWTMWSYRETKSCSSLSHDTSLIEALFEMPGIENEGSPP